MAGATWQAILVVLAQFKTELFPCITKQAAVLTTAAGDLYVLEWQKHRTCSKLQAKTAAIKTMPARQYAACMCVLCDYLLPLLSKERHPRWKGRSSNRLSAKTLALEQMRCLMTAGG